MQTFKSAGFSMQIEFSILPLSQSVELKYKEQRIKKELACCYRSCWRCEGWEIEKIHGMSWVKMKTEIAVLIMILSFSCKALKFLFFYIYIEFCFP